MQRDIEQADRIYRYGKAIKRKDKDNGEENIRRKEQSTAERK